ncbi:hypothetical protein GWI33_019152 [Rhynchophorus ferrugineus]|uniref:Uncharacterized protein n=1 Tax=Rhynchophorus ferrugineus TaxID=354439 RepID=A0A834HV16_RHYFE|nr:hypothetical protein GWI33_019152 [Rhynchophorus ferrugineus]
MCQNGSLFFLYSFVSLGILTQFIYLNAVKFSETHHKVSIISKIEAIAELLVLDSPDTKCSESAFIQPSNFEVRSGVYVQSRKPTIPKYIKSFDGRRKKTAVPLSPRYLSIPVSVYRDIRVI